MSNHNNKKKKKVPHRNSSIPIAKKAWHSHPIFAYAAMVLTIAFIAYGSISISLLHDRAAENEALRQINQTQAVAIADLQQTTDVVQQQLGDVVAREAEIKSILGMEQTEVGGLGGEATALSEPTVVSEPTEIFDYTENLSAMESSLVSLSVDLKNYSGALSTLQSNAESYVASRNAFPDAWPLADCRITSYFGSRANPFDGEETEGHEALDLAKAYGAAITASGSGIVISAGWNGGYGYSIEIDHGNGYTTRYSHCATLLAEVGDTIEKGQQIATLGSTGRSTGPHLDFRVYYQGTCIDPLTVLVAQ